MTVTKALTLHAEREGTGLSVDALCVQAALTSTSSNGIDQPVVTITNGQMLSGHGSIVAPLVFKDGAIFDTADSREGYWLTLTDATITWPESGEVKVKSDKTVQLMQFATEVDLSHFALENTGSLTGLYLHEEALLGGVTMLYVLKEMDSASLPEEIAGNAAVKEAIQAAIETWAASGFIITEIKAATAQNTAGDAMGSAQAVDCFINLETTVTVAPDWEGGDFSKGIATVTYDFGVSQITVKKAQLAGDDAAQNYVLACAKVSNGKAEEVTAAGYATGTTVSLLLDGTEATGAVALDTATLSNKFGLTAGLGEQWFALPMKKLALGTREFTVRATNTPQAEVTP